MKMKHIFYAKCTFSARLMIFKTFPDTPNGYTSLLFSAIIKQRYLLPAFIYVSKHLIKKYSNWFCCWHLFICLYVRYILPTSLFFELPYQYCEENTNFSKPVIISLYFLLLSLSWYQHLSTLLSNTLTQKSKVKAKLHN